MDRAVLLIHFGEPAEPDPDLVEQYLTRIFFQNADLDEVESEDAARDRAATLAARRAPSLLEEYESIGGSPLNAQAHDQAAELQTKLADRGYDVPVHLAFQFMDPSIDRVIEEAHDTGVEELIVLPVYPLCGPSTTVAALETTDRAIERGGYSLEVTQLSGWHRHPTYLRMRAENIREKAEDAEICLSGPETTMVFSAHGTPQRYVDAGSRYVQYVEEVCRAVAGLAGIDAYHIGYQNHENRNIPWTAPDVEDLITDLAADRILVEPISFVHEQSETLVELDRELAAVASEVGTEFHRVPIPYADERLSTVLADVIEPTLAQIDPQLYHLRPCRCKPGDSTYCLNAPIR